MSLPKVLIWTNASTSSFKPVMPAVRLPVKLAAKPNLPSLAPR